VPWQLAFAANNSVEGAGDDERDARADCHHSDLPCGGANAK
jgi:hypothetical protein